MNIKLLVIFVVGNISKRKAIYMGELFHHFHFTLNIYYKQILLCIV